jgi:hypothetical protein
VQQRQSRGKPDPRDSLTRKQRELMRLVARGATIADAARASDVNEERAKRWALIPRFRDALAMERAHPSPALSAMADALRDSIAGDEPPSIPESPSARRSKAMDLLASGATITDAAEQSGYSRQHLSALVNHDVEFKAEYKRRIAEDHERRANFFWARWDQSGQVVKQSLDEGDPRTAMEIFKLGARGVTDIDRRESITQQDDLPALPLPPPLSDTPQALPAPDPSGYSCEDCGLVAKSQRGLKQHQTARHNVRQNKEKK